MKGSLWRVALAAVLCLGAGESYRRTVPLETPVPAAPPVEVPFGDVEFGERWYDGAQYGYRRGLVRGMTEREFGGELTATRAMAATMVWRMAGEPEVWGSSGFLDVEPGRYYTPAVVWGETRGLWQGYGDGTFRPDTGVSWEQLELILGRYLGAGEGELVRPSFLAQPGPESPRGAFSEDPPQELTRGELAEVLMEVCEGRK